MKKKTVENNFCKAIIFDMDGTLVDSVKSDYLAWERLFSFYNKTLSYEEYLPMMRIKSAEIVRQYLPVKNDEEVQFALTIKPISVSEDGFYLIVLKIIFL